MFQHQRAQGEFQLISCLSSPDRLTVGHKAGQQAASQANMQIVLGCSIISTELRAIKSLKSGGRLYCVSVHGV